MIAPLLPRHLHGEAEERCAQQIVCERALVVHDAIGHFYYPFTHKTCFSVCTMSIKSPCAAMTASMLL